ncbi:MAG: hypothetical protein ACRERU_05180 [Methylococcales bacterium]
MVRPYSEWCQKELEEFTTQNQQNTERYFVVELDAIGVDDRPEILRKAFGYRFWYEHEISKKTYPFTPDSEVYRNNIVDLAKDLAAQIQQAENLNQAIRLATQATRNNAYPEAIEFWQKSRKVSRIIPPRPNKSLHFNKSSNTKNTPNT